jgi:hypothetical protein
VGLELAEIVMDLEDEFCLELPESRLRGTRVADLEDLVLACLPRESIAAAIALVPMDEADGGIDHDAYLALWRENHSLPVAERWFGLQRRRVARAEIVRALEERLARYHGDDQVRAGVRRIIAERLSLPAVASTQDLIADLRCD